MMMDFPTDFISQIQGLLGPDSEAFFKAMSEPPAVSIKMNRRKSETPVPTGYESLSPVAWCNSGYYLPERPTFTLNPLMHAGVFYVQDASSMIYEELTRVAMQRFFEDRPIRALDMCAAPGGKTTSIINALPDNSVVVANEFIGQRAEILKENLFKWGYPEIFITNSPTSRLAKLGETFDLVAVDAPCSGEGMMRKEAVARSQWNPGLVRQCAELQREILTDAIQTLKPGGILIYSTCTFNREENEENLQWLVDNFDMEVIDPMFPSDWGIMPGIDTPHAALRFMPHRTRGEGLFAAMLRKPGEWQRSASSSRRGKSLGDELRSCARLIAEGIPVSTTKGRDEIPTAEGALRTDHPDSKLPHVELNDQQALDYLRHEALRLDASTPKGCIVVTYKGFPLGTAKNIGSRANNLYPKNWKIRNL